MKSREANDVRKLIAATILLCLASAALAADAPKVTVPADGDKVWTRIQVIGQTQGKHFVIIITDVYVKGQEKPIGSVPGLRHWTEEDGKFNFGIAAPRVIRGHSADLVYKIRVFVQDPGTAPGPETVITCYPK